MRRIGVHRNHPEPTVTTFSHRIRPHVQAELDAAAAQEALGHFHAAFQHLERAHVLGQPATVEHVRVHWRMFRFALRMRVGGEVYGQAWRLVAALVFTPLGLVPPGNTGGADISGVRRLPVPPDLQALIVAARQGSSRAGGSRHRWLAGITGLAALAALGLGACSIFDRYAQATVSGDGRGQEVLSRQDVNGLRLFLGKTARC
jgi:hypothetical protein